VTVINHARTLLLNISAGGYGIGEEYVPPRFRSLRLPSFLLAIRRQLFGTDPDRDMMNYRGRQLMQILHATQLREYVEGLDPRITYDFTGRELADDALFMPEVVRQAGTSTDRFYLLGAADTPDSTGKTRFDVRVDVLTESTVRVQMLTPTPQIRIYDLEFTDGLSNIVSLLGTGYQFRISESPGALWVVRGVRRPRLSLGEIAANVQSLGEPVLTELFGTSTTLEPYLTFRNLWNTHPELPYSFGGLLMALIYRTEEARRGQS
jgi:hypothetical protein